MHLSEARQQLGLFQHHDAVTGTSKLYVMSDYAERLFRGIKGAHSVIAHVMQYLQSVRKPNYQPPPDQTSYDKGYHQDQIPFTTYLQMSEKRISFDTLPIRVGLHLGPSRIDDLAGQTSTKRTAKVVVFNSHASEVQEAIRVHVTGPVQKVVGPNGRELEFQLNPVWGYSAELPTNLYELLFIAELAPLSTTTFEVVRQAVSEKSRTPATRIRLFLSDSWEKDSPEGEKPTLSNGHLFNFETSDDEDIRMTNGNIHVVFNRSTGLLQSVNGRTISMSFGAYRSAEFHSGAYLFRPNPMEPRHNVTGRFPVIRLVRGPLMSELIVVYPDTVMQRARVYHKAPGRAALTAGIELETSFDLSARHDFLEMYMTFESDVASGQEFFTDSAGFEILRRLRNDLLPVEANYYPMTEAVFIQDDSSRLTLLADHAHGVTSSKPGHLEVMLDRKLRFDDSRGLGEGIMDNRHTRSRFWLLMEIRDQNRLDKTISSERQEISLLSRSGHRLATMLNFPPVIMQSLPTGLSRMVHGEIRFLAEPLPCDVHLLNIRTLPEEAGTDATYNHPSLDRALLVLQSRAADCSITVSPNNPLNCGTQKSERGVFFSNVTVTSIQRTTLTGTMPNGEEVSPKNLRVDPHELESFIITFGKSNYNNGVESNNNNHSIHKKMSIPTTTTTQITV
ncbi:alpha-mannosidase 2-like [Tropilaelaps mercedesae]|uniref:Alpha-mannosidase 2-like n=1 Tax=Tropilaelaps mercedesae TaxID=418985 RepID=A0A1V9XQP8_9ACAR|nr:alpha-mannosidase 2-like [Tropilaelaps mercedesae]